jgi:glutaredoxin
VATLELFGTSRCPYTEEMRDWLERRSCDFVEYDVETNSDARRRMREISGGTRSVPLLAEDGKVIQIGWQGRACVVDLAE